MIINQFNFTQSGNFNFIDNDGKDVTQEVTLNFQIGEDMTRLHNKCVEVPEELFGNIEAYLTDTHGDSVFFDESITKIFFTNKTTEKLEYIVFNKEKMFLGLYLKKPVKKEMLLSDISLSFEKCFLRVKVPFELKMPYFFEIHTNEKDYLVNFEKKESNIYLLAPILVFGT